MARPKSLVIVDGYNVLRSGSRYKPIQFPDYTTDPLNQARERLLNDVIMFCGSHQEPIIVFDALNNEYASQQTDTQLGSVRVMFTRYGQSADSLIEKLAFEAKEKHLEALVITSDASIQDTVFKDGITRMSAEGFCQQMELREEEINEEEHPKVSYKTTIAHRIPSETLEKLKQLRDSL